MDMKHGLPEKIMDQKDCLSCKISGTSAFLGISGYALYVQYDIMRPKMENIHGLQNRLKYSVAHGPKWLVGLSAAFSILAIARATK